MIAGPRDPSYLHEKSTRDEVSRVFDHCVGCRQCVDLCPTFPTLFELVDRFDVPDAGRLTPFEQDTLVDGCFQCGVCVDSCPYAPDRHEWSVDVPRTVLRTVAMRRATGQLGLRTRLAGRILGVVGRRATSRRVLAFAGRSRPGSLGRRLVAAVAGISAVRPIPPFSPQRFSEWFASRGPHGSGRDDVSAQVTIFPTCIVEYQEVATGRDLVGVYEHHGVACSLATAGCCGQAALHSGDLDRFTAVAAANLAVLGAEVRRGRDIVVPEPGCARMLTHHYADHVDAAWRADAELVAAHTFDAAEYLLRTRPAAASVARVVGADGEVPERVVYHPAGQLVGGDRALAAQRLLEAAGTRVQVVTERSGAEAMWSCRADGDRVVTSCANRLDRALHGADGDVVTGESHLANRVIAERTGLAATHPVRVLARALGIPHDDPGPER